MDIWLPFHHGGLERALRIISTVDELQSPGGGTSQSSHGKPLGKLVEDEWVGEF